MANKKYDIDKDIVFIKSSKYEKLLKNKNIVKALHQAGISRHLGFYYENAVKDLKLYRDKDYRINQTIKDLMYKKNGNYVDLTVFEYMKLSDYNSIYKTLVKDGIKNTQFYKDTMVIFLKQPREL